jgi:hypothetical protein
MWEKYSFEFRNYGGEEAQEIFKDACKKYLEEKGELYMTRNYVKIVMLRTENLIDWVRHWSSSLKEIHEWKNSNSGPLAWSDEFRKFNKDRSRRNNQQERDTLIAEMEAIRQKAKATNRPTYKYDKMPKINAKEKAKRARAKPAAARRPRALSPQAAGGIRAESPQADDDRLAASLQSPGSPSPRLVQIDDNADGHDVYLLSGDDDAVRSVHRLTDPARSVYIRAYEGIFQFLSIPNNFGDDEHHDLAKESEYVELEEYVHHLSNNTYDKLSEIVQEDVHVKEAFKRSTQLIHVNQYRIYAGVPDSLQQFIIYGEHVRQLVNELRTKAALLDAQDDKKALENIAEGIDPENTQEFLEYKEQLKQAKETQEKIQQFMEKIRSAETPHALEDALAEARQEFENDDVSTNTITTSLEAKMLTWFNTGGCSTPVWMDIEDMTRLIEVAYDSIFVSNRFKQTHDLRAYIAFVEKLRHIASLLNTAEFDQIRTIESQEGKTIPQIFKGGPTYTMEGMTSIWTNSYKWYKKVAQKDQAEDVELTTIDCLLNKAYEAAGDVKRRLVSDNKMLSLYLTGGTLKHQESEKTRQKVLELLGPLVDEQVQKFRKQDDYRAKFVSDTINACLPHCQRKKYSSTYVSKTETPLWKAVLVMCMSEQFKTTSFWTRSIFTYEDIDAHSYPTKQEIDRVAKAITKKMNTYVGMVPEQDIIKSVKTMFAFMAAYGNVDNTAKPEVYFKDAGWNENEFPFERNEEEPEISRLDDDDDDELIAPDHGTEGGGHAEEADDGGQEQEEDQQPQPEKAKEVKNAKKTEKAEKTKKRAAEKQDAAPPAKKLKAPPQALAVKAAGQLAKRAGKKTATKKPAAKNKNKYKKK